MTDKIPASGQVRPEDEAQGQKMTIYMPQGAVIIERSELEPPAELSHRLISEEAPAPPKVGVDSVQSQGAVINIYTGDDSHSVGEQSHSKVLATDSAYMTDQQVLLRINEMLDVITKRLDHNGKPTDSVDTGTLSDEESDKKAAVPQVGHEVEKQIAPDGHEVEKQIAPNGYLFDWMHAFNLMYLFIVLLVPILPTGLQSLFGVKIIPALISYEAAGIQRGDLLIAEEVRASSLVAGDILSLHNAFAGTSEVLQVIQISGPGDNGIMIFTIPPRVDQNLALSYSVDRDLVIHKVVKMVPTFGTVKMFLESFYVQFYVGLSVILLNVIVHFRRHRRYRAGRV